MDCDFCKKEKATIFLSQIFKGEVIKLDLCEACAKKLEVTDVQGVAVNELIEKIQKIQEEQEPIEDKTCTKCGFSMNEIHETGRLGCDECYDYFQPEVSEIIKQTQKKARHKGKNPSDREDDMNQQRLDDLQTELGLAIENEDYEKAARLRDRIKSQNISG
ncbi:MAG: UvrB/UvrC motif-containing protein [Verrucomicrobiota bacterium]